MGAEREKTLLRLLFSVVTVAAILAAGSPGIKTAEAAHLRTITSIYVFGDSTADVGNNNFLSGNRSKANHPYFGVDFPGGVPTGRFSNGYNSIDFLAQMLGYKLSPPPFLSVQNSTAQFYRGLSFASGGAGILDATMQGPNSSIPMNTQIHLFENVVDTITNSLGPKRAKYFLSKALFVFSVGSNDMFGYFVKFGPGTNSTTKDQFVGLLMATYKAQLLKLYSLGARKFAVSGTATLGCVPAVRANNPTGGCNDELNDLSQRFNNATVGLLKTLAVELKGMKYSFTNNYRVITDVLSKPLHFGYKELKSACCGGGKFNAEFGCTLNATLCADRRQYFFWDSVHPSQATYKLVAVHAYKGSRLYATPMNIQHLARL